MKGPSIPLLQLINLPDEVGDNVRGVPEVLRVPVDIEESSDAIVEAELLRRIL